VSQFFYWGCWGGRGSGHRCLDIHGRHVSSDDRPEELSDKHLDNSYPATLSIPNRFPPNQPLGVQRLVHVKTSTGAVWTLLSMWDRSGDERFGSHSNFVAEGEKTRDEMKALIHEHFPALYKRIITQAGWPSGLG